jgi:dehydrogenase/reductase SDR family protein 7B
MQQFYRNKVIWITGASSGIGAALVGELANFQVKLIISARSISALNQLKETYQSFPAEIFVLPFDLEQIDHFENVVKDAMLKFGRIDLLFNNGGLSQRSLVSETSLHVDRKIMEINFFANIQLTKLVLPHMLKYNYGHLVITSSLSGKFGFYQRSAYAASKHALHGFYESLFLENRDKGINVTMVCPGSIKTNIAMAALNKDGFASSSIDKRLEKGMSAKICANKIIKAVAKEKKEIIIGKFEIIPVYLKRFIPVLFWQVMFKLKPH